MAWGMGRSAKSMEQGARSKELRLRRLGEEEMWRLGETCQRLKDLAGSVKGTVRLGY